jgi:hypothetical protein
MVYSTNYFPKEILPWMKKIVKQNCHVLVAKLLQLIIMMIFNIWTSYFYNNSHQDYWMKKLTLSSWN